MTDQTKKKVKGNIVPYEIRHSAINAAKRIKDENGGRALPLPLVGTYSDHGGMVGFGALHVYLKQDENERKLFASYIVAAVNIYFYKILQL